MESRKLLTRHLSHIEHCQHASLHPRKLGDRFLRDGGPENRMGDFVEDRLNALRATEPLINQDARARGIVKKRPPHCVTTQPGEPQQPAATVNRDVVIVRHMIPFARTMPAMSTNPKTPANAVQSVLATMTFAWLASDR
jgi:hypothetical protein